MTDQLSTVAAGVSAIASSILGAKVLPLLAQIPNAPPMPQWMTWLLGPLGALIGMIFAVWWLAGRLNRAEAKADKREEERDADRKTLIQVVEQNSTVIREVTEAINKIRNRE